MFRKIDQQDLDADDDLLAKPLESGYVTPIKSITISKDSSELVNVQDEFIKSTTDWQKLNETTPSNATTASLNRKRNFNLISEKTTQVRFVYVYKKKEIFL